MDSIAWGFVESVIIDLVFLLVILVVFCMLKRFRCNPDPTLKYNLFLQESKMSPRDLFYYVIHTHLLSIRNVCGEESYNYLFLCKILAIFTTILCGVSLPILLPVYSVGTTGGGSMFIIGFYNIIADSDLIIAPIMLFIVSIVASYFMLIVYIRESMQNQSNSTINKHAARIVRLPKELQKEELETKISECLGQENMTVYVVPALRKALLLQKELDYAKEEFMHYTDVEIVKGKRETVKTNKFYGKKRDAIEFWGEKVEELEKELEEEKELSVANTTGVCILVFAEPVEIQEIRDKCAKAFPKSKVLRIVIPSDINWENIDVDDCRIKWKPIFYTLLFFYAFLIVLTPTAFLGYINKILRSIGLSSGLLGFLSVYMPGTLLLLYQIVLVPTAVTFLVRKEHHISKSNEILSAMRKYLLFFMFNILFIPAVGMQLIDIMAMVIYSASELSAWSEAMIKRVNNTSMWFMAFIVTQAFIVNGIELIQVGRLFGVRFKAFRAVGDREKYNAYLPAHMEYAPAYAILLTCFTAIILYSISYPLILLFGCIYLWIKVRDMQYFVSKYNIMCLYSRECIPSTAVSIAVKSYAVAVILFQWVTCFMIILAQIEPFTKICFVILGLGIVLFLTFWVKYNSLSKLFAVEERKGYLQDPYIHPLDRKQS